MHLFIYSSIHPFTYSSIHQFTYSYINLFIYLSIHLFIFSFIHLFIYSFIIYKKQGAKRTKSYSLLNVNKVQWCIQDTVLCFLSLHIFCIIVFQEFIPFFIFLVVLQIEVFRVCPMVFCISIAELVSISFNLSYLVFLHENFLS